MREDVLRNKIPLLEFTAQCREFSCLHSQLSTTVDTPRNAFALPSVWRTPWIKPGFWTWPKRFENSPTGTKKKTGATLKTDKLSPSVETAIFPPPRGH